MALQVCVCVDAKKNNNFTVEHICILQQLQRSSFLLRCWVCNVFAAASHRGGIKVEFYFFKYQFALEATKIDLVYSPENVEMDARW